jgi:hypothetical protein
MSFTSIFDGKTLDGWKMAGEGRFIVAELDATLQSEGGMDYCGTQKNIQKLHTQIGMEVSTKGDNSGVFVRFSDPDNNPNNAGREGYEIR